MGSVSLKGSNMDELKKRADAFANLLHTRYDIILGRKNVLINISLNFDKTHFHHLIGLNRLTDKPQLKKDRAKVFDEIMNGKITYNHINSSTFFKDIEARFLSFLLIEHLLDNNGLFFKFNRKANPLSKMKTEFILESTINGDTAYICIDNYDNTDEYFCRSFFPKEENDYTAKHTRYTLLRKEKLDTISGSKTIQYDRLTSKASID